jgi:hypothetical protein
MKLFHIKFDKKQLDRIPEAERTLLILLAHAANELSVLTKLFQFSSKHEANSEMEIEARNAQAMALGRILTGKLYECWKIFPKAFFSAQLSKSYEQKFDTDATKALASLKKYFSATNLIATVRNSQAFHYDADQVATGYKDLPPEQPLNAYMSATNANTLYAFADVIAGYSLMRDIDPGNPARAFDSLVVDTAKVVGWLNQVIGACMTVAIGEYLGGSVDALGATQIELQGAPDWKYLTIPYFVEIAESEIT